MGDTSFELIRVLGSGMTISLANQAEWILYNDIFVDGEYDFAINRALESARSDQPATFLDLGANVGFFGLRVLDQMEPLLTDGADFQIIMVEGSPAVYKRLQKRLTTVPFLAERCISVPGLVGEKSGYGRLLECGFHANNSLFAENMLGEYKCVIVPYVDLEVLCAAWQYISLLKCDIEGAEELFLENYPEFLDKVQYAVFEFHFDLCDVSHCFALLDAAGFSHRRQLSWHSHTKNITYLFWR